MAARAAGYQERSSDAIKISRWNICPRVGLHTLNRALNLSRLHRNRRTEAAGAMAFDTVLYQDLAHPQWPKHRDVALAGEIGRQVLDPLLKLTDLEDQGDDKDEIGEDRQQDDGAKTIASDRSFRLHITTLLRHLARRPPVAPRRAVLSLGTATLHGWAGCAPTSRKQTKPPP